MAPQPRRQSACVRLRQEDLFAFASSAEKGPGFGAPRAGAAYAPKSAESSFDRTFAIHGVRNGGASDASQQGHPTRQGPGWP